MKNALRIAVVEDNETMREGLEQVLQHFGHEVVSFGNGENALKQLRNGDKADVLISDYKLPGMNGLDLLGKAREHLPELEMMMITAFGSIDLAVQAMQKGAADFITKPFSADEIGVKVERIAERLLQRRKLRKLEAENQYFRREVEAEFNAGEIIGAAPSMQAVFKTIEKVAKTDATVIIFGESGTGKELVARAIHKNSARRENPFVRVNCGALAEGVLESEMFGHEKGSFTGALRKKLGRFELANEGTIFLDEIGDISPSMQVRLLRVLQEREFERVGGEETIHVDVRVIAATHRDLKAEVDAGRFREDLYYRLHIVPLTIPPLRQRLDDVTALANHFLTRAKSAFNRPGLQLDEQALQALAEYHWPGNVRELENVIERSAVLCDGDTISVEDLPLLVKDESAMLTLSEDEMDLNKAVDQVERALIERAMKLAHGVKAEAARKLGIKTTTLLYKLSKFGIE